MLEYIRSFSQGVIGRSIMTVVLGLLVFSFAVWGAGDAFRGFGMNKVATVGGQTITPAEFRNSYQTALRRYQEQTRAPLSSAQAHAIGLDTQTLGRLIADAALDQRAKTLDLAMSDQQIAKAVRAAPELQDASGAFSRDRFNEELRNSGLSEAGFFNDQRQTLLRQQIGIPLASGLTAPKVLIEALVHFGTQSRDIAYVVLPDSAAGEIAQPTPKQLQTFFDERKESYRAPEYRSIDTLALSPDALAKPSEVSDADARALYDKVKAQRYGVPETRAIQQIVFPSEAEAQAAADKIKAGASFDDIAKARKLTDKDINLGDVTKAGVFDPAVADAAFALAQGGVSGVVKGRFGPVIVRAQTITPGHVKPYEEVEGELKKQIAAGLAADKILALHDKIEDARASGKTIDDAAKAVGLSAHPVALFDASGNGMDGKPVAGLADKAALLRAVFASDIGADDSALDTKDRGFVWFDVTKIEPARDRSFDEVKDKVAAQWRANEIAIALSKKAAAMTQQLKSGVPLASLAEPDKLEVKTAANVRRAGAEGLAQNVVAAVFDAPPDGAGSATTKDGRLVFKITADATPAVNFDDPKIKQLTAQATEGMTNDLISEYISELQRELGVTVNAAALQAAMGG